MLPDTDVMRRFVAAMDDDLDTPAATAVLFDTVRRGNAALDEGDDQVAPALVAAANEIAVAFGLVLGAPGAGDDAPAAVLALAAERDAARAAKDWARADGMRDALTADGWLVEATAGGTRERRA